MDLSPTRRTVKRALVGGGALLGAFVGLIGIEVLSARGGERLAGYTRDQLEGIVAPGPGDPLRLTWIGDSTGRGVGASDAMHALPQVVARGLIRPVHLTVLAESGARVADAVVDQVPLLAARKPDWVVVGIGSNDVIHLTSRSTFRRRLDRLLDRVGEIADRVIVLGIGEFASTPRFAQPLRWILGARGHQLDSDVRAAARDHNALYVDITGRTGREFVADPGLYHASDRFHPSDAGYALWARATLDTIREAGW